MGGSTGARRATLRSGSYGACFCFTLPVWLGTDETPEQRPSGRAIAVWILAAMMGMVITFEILRHLVGPHFTEVQRGSRGMGVSEGTCLQR